MKTKYIILQLLILLTVFGCQTEDIADETGKESVMAENMDIEKLHNKDFIQTASIKEKLVYKEFHLSSLMEQVLEVNPEFENMEEFKTAKGEASYSLQNLLLDGIAKKKGGTSTSKDDIPSLDAFTDLEGETWYPVLRRLKKGEGNGNNSLYLINSYDTDAEEEIVKAYKLDENGKLVLTHKRFTEEMFSGSQTSKESSSVYQLRLSECPIAQDMLKIAARGCGSGSSGGGISSYSTKIRNMTIKDKKESWIEKADVHYARISWSLLAPGVYYDNCPPVQYPFCDGKGKLIRKYKNREVRKRQSKSVNFTINTSSSNHAVLQFAVFEYDSWPAGIKTYQEDVNGATINLKYRSWNDPYDERTVTFTGAYGLQNGRRFTVDNSAIKYNVY